jgi:hypothetical protein
MATAEKSTEIFTIPRILGLSVFGGIGIMKLFFWPGVGIVYFGFLVVLL